MGHDGILRIRITSIKTACNTESLDADEGEATDNGHNGGGLSSEHGTNVEIQRHSLLGLLRPRKNGSILGLRVAIQSSNAFVMVHRSLHCGQVV